MLEYKSEVNEIGSLKYLDLDLTQDNTKKKGKN